MSSSKNLLARERRKTAKPPGDFLRELYGLQKFWEHFSEKRLDKKAQFRYACLLACLLAKILTDSSIFVNSSFKNLLFCILYNIDMRM